MELYDYFVAQLCCSSCGDRSSRDRSTNIKTRLATDPVDAALGIGDDVRFDLSRVPKRGYRAIRSPRPGEGIRLLEAWTCPACGAQSSWVEVQIAGGIVQAIDVVPVDLRALEHAHFLSEAAVLVVERVGGRALQAVAAGELVAQLREVLA